jgi:PKD protein
MQELQIGRVYRHFKGDYYLVEGLAHDSESGVPCVIYRKLYGDGGLWVRPLEMFLSRVDREKYPEVRQEYRFQLQEIASVAHHGECGCPMECEKIHLVLCPACWGKTRT